MEEEEEGKEKEDDEEEDDCDEEFKLLCSNSDLKLLPKRFLCLKYWETHIVHLPFPTLIHAYHSNIEKYYSYNTSVQIH